MKLALSAVLVFLCASIQAQIIIDDFSIGANEQSIDFTLPVDVSSGGSPAITQSFFFLTPCSGLLGCERDAEIVIFSGDDGDRFTLELSGGEMEYVAPSGTITTLTLQYDGIDQDFDLDEEGLDSTDITSFNSFVISASLNGAVSARITVYDSDEDTCRVEFSMDDNDDNYVIAFSRLSSGCNMQDVGAIELEISANGGVQFIGNSFRIDNSVIDPDETESTADFPSYTFSPITATFSTFSTFSASSFSPASSPSGYASQSSSDSNNSPSSSSTQLLVGFYVLLSMMCIAF